MFDIGWSELLVVAVVAIIFIGPRELVPMLRTFGQYAGKLKRMAGEFQSQFNEALREAELDQITKEVEDIRKSSPVGDIKKELESEMQPIGASMEDLTRPIKPKAESAPDKGDGAKADEKAAAKPAKSEKDAGTKPAKAEGKDAASPQKTESEPARKSEDKGA
ncbi:MAG TPA: Sec-independent protein translocase protein TatB, partial [Hyphomicrobiales bacterium]|nr:Sec-independent protein translocase protein TatB [Hyphomicrobiales bacterium]